MLVRLRFQHSAVILEGCETSPGGIWNRKSLSLLGRALLQCWVFYPDECGMGLANACGDDGTDVSLVLFVSGKMCLCLGQSQTPDKTRHNQNECPVARMGWKMTDHTRATQSATRVLDCRDLLSLPCTAHSHPQSGTACTAHPDSA